MNSTRQSKISQKNSQDQKKTKFQRLELARGLQIIPNIFTLGNAFFGFCSVIFASEGEFVSAAYCILLGAMMDTLDGQIARLFRIASDFGVQLDSLCDGVTFCLAPAFLIYSWQLYKFGVIGSLICSILLAMGVMRLAKFNITASAQTHYFIGVPTPMSACLFASIVLNFGGSCIHFYGRVCLSVMIVIVACLMVSIVRIPTFKHLRKGWYAVAISSFAGAAVVFGFVKMLMFIFFAYFSFVLIKCAYTILLKALMKTVEGSVVQDSEHNLA